MKKLICLLLIIVMLFAMASVVFADNVPSAEKHNTDVEGDDDNRGKSPQTGEDGTVYWVVCALVLAIGAVLFCGKKLVCNK